MTFPLCRARPDVSIHAPPEEGDAAGHRRHDSHSVSIHAPPEEGDARHPSRSTGRVVSIHAPPEEGDIVVVILHGANWFQSTPPRRRATLATCYLGQGEACFNPRPPGGGRRSRAFYRTCLFCFNPRPPGGGRHLSAVNHHQPTGFNPRPPGGGRRRAADGASISICFNPRPPGGGRLK